MKRLIRWKKRYFRMLDMGYRWRIRKPGVRRFSTLRPDSEFLIVYDRIYGDSATITGLGEVGVWKNAVLFIERKQREYETKTIGNRRFRQRCWESGPT